MAETIEAAVVSTLLSLMGIVQELAYAVGDRDWASVVENTLDKHRNEIRWNT